MLNVVAADLSSRHKSDNFQLFPHAPVLLKVDETKEYCKVWLAFKEVGTVACGFFVGKP
jgi:hypothetical protein